MQIEQVCAGLKAHYQAQLNCFWCTFLDVSNEDRSLDVQVPEAEFFVVEQALLAAGGRLAAAPASKAASALRTRKLPAVLASNNAMGTTLTSGISVESKKRKLPPAFAQQQKQAAPAALTYKVHALLNLA